MDITGTFPFFYTVYVCYNSTSKTNKDEFELGIMQSYFRESKKIFEMQSWNLAEKVPLKK